MSVFVYAVQWETLGYNNVHRSTLYDVVVYDLAKRDSLYTGQKWAHSTNFLNMFENYPEAGRYS